MKKLESIQFKFKIDGQEYGSEFLVNKEAEKKDAVPIGEVMRKWLTKSLEEVL